MLLNHGEYYNNNEPCLVTGVQEVERPDLGNYETEKQDELHMAQRAFQDLVDGLSTSSLSFEASSTFSSDRESVISETSFPKSPLKKPLNNIRNSSTDLEGSISLLSIFEEDGNPSQNDQQNITDIGNSNNNNDKSTSSMESATSSRSSDATEEMQSPRRRAGTGRRTSRPRQHENARRARARSCQPYEEIRRSWGRRCKPSEDRAEPIDRTRRSCKPFEKTQPRRAWQEEEETEREQEEEKRPLLRRARNPEDERRRARRRQSGKGSSASSSKVMEVEGRRRGRGRSRKQESRDKEACEEIQDENQVKRSKSKKKLLTKSSSKQDLLARGSSKNNLIEKPSSQKNLLGKSSSKQNLLGRSSSKKNLFGKSDSKKNLESESCCKISESDPLVLESKKEHSGKNPETSPVYSFFIKGSQKDSKESADTRCVRSRQSRQSFREGRQTAIKSRGWHDLTQEEKLEWLRATAREEDEEEKAAGTGAREQVGEEPSKRRDGKSLNPRRNSQLAANKSIANCYRMHSSMSQLITTGIGVTDEGAIHNEPSCDFEQEFSVPAEAFENPMECFLFVPPQEAVQ